MVCHQALNKLPEGCRGQVVKTLKALRMSLCTLWYIYGTPLMHLCAEGEAPGQEHDCSLGKTGPLGSHPVAGRQQLYTQLLSHAMQDNSRGAQGAVRCSVALSQLGMLL